MRPLAVLTLALVFYLASALAAYADTYTVDDTTDAVDANPADGLCLTAGGKCSLRAAIQQANAHTGADEVVVPPGTYKLTVLGAGEDAAATGDLDITDDLTVTSTGSGLLQATGHEVNVDGNSTDRVFDVKAGVTATFTLLEIFSGRAAADPRGGGILNAGTLVLDRDFIEYNWADDGAGNGDGGGVYNLGTLTVNQSTLWSNQAFDGPGAGLYNAGTMSVVNSTVVQNNCCYTHGPSGGGAGIYNAAIGTLDLRNATVALNGNGLNFANNGSGNGVFNDGGTVTLKNSVIAGNLSNPPGDCAGALTSAGYDLIEDPTGCTLSGDMTGVQTGIDPGFWVTLASSDLGGGPTPVLQIVTPASPLIDTGNPAPPGSGGDACEARDQRGVPRALGITRCDIGAEELDRCAPFPFAPCHQQFVGAHRGKIDLKDNTDDTKDALHWSFDLGPAGAFGTVEDDFALCIYDQTGLVLEARVPGGGTCGTKPCWKESPTTLKYANKSTTPDGLAQVKFTAPVGKSTKIDAKGKGTLLKFLPLPWTGQVVAVMTNESIDACWEASYSTPTTDSTARFTSRGD